MTTYDIPVGFYSSLSSGVAGDASGEVKPTVFDTATVTVSSTVNGKPRRRQRQRRARSGAVTTVSVAKSVMAAARQACRPGEHVKVVSATRVDIVPD